MKKIVSIVVTYNGMEWIGKCLGSLANSSCATEIVVIDNGSTDTTISFIKENFPGVQLIESKENLGFGQANNIGFRIAIEKEADYVFLLNQDAWVETDTIGCLVQALQKHIEYGIVSPLHFNGSGSAFDKYFLDYLKHSGANENDISVILQNNNQHLLVNTSFVNAAAWC
ncbi:MAG: glycosyltransferase, partial [Chitinophagaceae bacterium]